MTARWPAYLYLGIQSLHQMRKMQYIKTLFLNFSSRTMCTSFGLRASTHSVGKHWMVSYYLNFWCRAYLIKKMGDKHFNQSHPSYFTLSRTVMLGLPYFAGVIFPIQPLLPVCCSHLIDTPTLYLTFPLRSGHYILFYIFFIHILIVRNMFWMEM